MVDIKDVDNLETLRERASENKSQLSDEEKKQLRKDVKEIIEKREEEDRRERLIEMERLYGASLFA